MGDGREEEAGAAALDFLNNIPLGKGALPAASTSAALDFLTNIPLGDADGRGGGGGGLGVGAAAAAAGSEREGGAGGAGRRGSVFDGDGGSGGSTRTGRTRSVAEGSQGGSLLQTSGAFRTSMGALPVGKLSSQGSSPAALHGPIREEPVAAAAATPALRKLQVDDNGAGSVGSSRSAIWDTNASVSLARQGTTQSEGLPPMRRPKYLEVSPQQLLVKNQSPRVILAHGCPVAVFSLLRANAPRRQAAKRKTPGEQNQPPTPSHAAEGARGKKTVSYQHLLESQRTEYDAQFLDDPMIRCGKNKTVMNLPSFMESVIPYVRPESLREELNEQFKQKHGWIDASFSLSKLRSLKKTLVEIALEADLELATVAIAYVYFEKLVLKNKVNKANRKALAGACLTLAIKVSDDRFDGGADELRPVVEVIRHHLVVDATVLARTEFRVFVELDFNLHIPLAELYPHFTFILNSLERSPQEYLGGAEVYSQHFSELEREEDRLAEEAEKEEWGAGGGGDDDDDSLRDERGSLVGAASDGGEAMHEDGRRRG